MQEITLLDRRRFNPYSTGFGSLSTARNPKRYYVVEFQSLFYWIWLSKEGGFGDSAELRNVSILILLDLAL